MAESVLLPVQTAITQLKSGRQYDSWQNETLQTQTRTVLANESEAAGIARRLRRGHLADAIALYLVCMSLCRLAARHHAHDAYDWLAVAADRRTRERPRARQRRRLQRRKTLLLCQRFTSELQTPFCSHLYHFLRCAAVRL